MAKLSIIQIFVETKLLASQPKLWAARPLSLMD